MNALQKKALSNMLKGLQTLGCNFIVVDSDGKKHEHGGVAERRAKNKNVGLTKYYGPFVRDLNPGESVEIPVGEYSLDQIQSGVSSILSKAWGNGSYITARNADKNIVEVLRVF
ncbi:MAG: hypothetical protein ACO3XZ_08965 [Ilumatobacteraceae bacterium]